MKKFEITEEQIKQAYDAACLGWKVKIRDWFPEAFKRQSGWYKNDDIPNWIAYYDFENHKVYGFACDSREWYSTNNLSPLNSDYLAPEEEVFERLKEEAIRRDYAHGTLCVFGSFKQKRKIEGLYPEYIAGRGLVMGKDVIFEEKTGKWAEIILTPEQPKEYITIDNHKYKLCE